VSGLSPLVDTLLANRLAQRLDLVPVKPELQIAGPGPVTKLDEVVNDIRLPSRSAVEQQIGMGLQKRDLSGAGGLAGRTEQAVTLSAAAQAVSAILDSPTVAASRILGSAPLMSWAQLPPSGQIATALSRLVGQSGLFYESHMAQFAAGSRTLAELKLEPQARLMGESIANVATVSDSSADSAQQVPILETIRAHKNAVAAIDVAEVTTLAVKGNDDSAPNAARSAPAFLGIHQDAVALVRQQLEVLAQSVFRWSGEAWPSVPMEWEIQADERQSNTTDEATPQTWSTRLTLTLPNLRDIDVRISLSGYALQVRLAASEDATRMRLGQARAGLPARLSAHGLDLTGLQIGSSSQSAETPGTPKANDVA
jgi:hypothetical protein